MDDKEAADRLERLSDDLSDAGASVSEGDKVEALEILQQVLTDLLEIRKFLNPDADEVL